MGVASVSQAAAINHHAPGFTLKDSQQQARTLADYRGTIVLINFWASWCGPCQDELPELNRLARRYKGRNVQVLAINVDQERRLAKKLIAQLGLTHPHLEILWDPRSKVVRAYSIDAMPSSYLLDRRGVIRYIHAGFHSDDPERWRKEIDELIRNPEP